MAIRTSWIDVYTPVVSRFRLDGGAMFGVVPRTMWSRVASPDSLGRIEMVSRIVVAVYESLGRIAVIDAGFGAAWSASDAARYGLELEHPGLAAALGALGISTSDVTDAVMTHLHFDHASGWVFEGSGGLLEPVLPRARHYVQRSQLEWARAPSLRDRGSFCAPHLEAMERSGLLHPLSGETELFEGLRLLVCDGHTPGMQVPLLGGFDQTLFYPSDLIPTAAHGRAAWIMAYDLEPLRSLGEKAGLMRRAEQEGWIVVLEHDPEVEAARIVSRDGALTLEPHACPARIRGLR